MARILFVVLSMFSLNKYLYGTDLCGDKIHLNEVLVAYNDIRILRAA